MTLPLTTGYPDFARQASEAQVLEINDINVNVPHGFVYPYRYVGNAKALQLWANPPSHGMRLQLRFAGDALGVALMDSYVVNMQSGDVAKQPVPILGPYLAVVVQHSNAATNNVTIQVWRTPRVAKFAGLEGDIAPFSQDGAAIGATSTITLDHQYVMEGPATYTLSVGGGNYSFKLQAIDYLNNPTLIDFCNGSGQLQQPRALWVPPWHLRAIVQNLSASATTYSFTMTRRHNI